ncbi:MAG: PqqD family protein [Acidobacteriota bacterium]|nr:PqqD family protein [Acidobacteriota bacterium]MDH3531015.1 PqqD family protein [Acidobacteriota bacterium]
MKNSQRPIARKKDLVIQKMPDELLVYDMDTGRAHCLNQTVAQVWEACDGKNSVADIAESMEENSVAGVNEDIVWLAIDQLQNHALLEKSAEISLSGQSRRDLIKKIGFASAVAIPVIASLAAPSSALAAASCSCVSDGDCGTQPACPSTACNMNGVCAP